MSNRVQVQYEIEVPKTWIEFCQGSDLFLRSYCGYWAYGAEHTSGLGWLLYEHGDDGIPPYFSSTREYRTAKRAWKAGQPLPERWFRLDDETVERAYTLGCELWGKSWYDGNRSDALGYDEIVQRTLLGEARYG